MNFINFKKYKFFGKKGSNQLNEPNYCRIAVNNKKFNDPNSGGKWCFIATTQAANLRLESMAISGNIQLTPSTEVSAQYWFDVLLPSIAITFKPKSTSLTQNGYCSNDPHCKTIDNR